MSSNHPHGFLSPFLLHLLLHHLLISITHTTSPCPTTPRITTCLPSFTTQPTLYTPCLTTPCFLFISEPPFTILPQPHSTAPQLPFPCHSPSPFSGITFLIHAETTPAETTPPLCVYAGDTCSFEDLIHFTRSHPNYLFAITGFLIHTPDRLCFHDPASSIMEDSMAIIGASLTGHRVDHLIRPFSTLTWFIFAIMLVFILITAFSIAFVSRGKPSLAASIFIATGNPVVSRMGNKHQALLKYAVSTTLLKISLGVLITLLALFYEAGVVNFLFQQNTAELGKRVRSLGVAELSRYSVLKESALEKVWNETVNPDGALYDPGKENPPWWRCNTSVECLRWVADPHHQVMFDVTFGTSARFLIQQVSSCGGWLYNQAIPSEYRHEVDRRLIGLRINGTLDRIFDKFLTRVACRQEISPQLGPTIVAVPLTIVVFPPLLASILILLCLRRGRPRVDGVDGIVTAEVKNHPSVSNTVSIQDSIDEISPVPSIRDSGKGSAVARASTQELEELPEP